MAEGVAAVDEIAFGPGGQGPGMPFPILLDRGGCWRPAAFDGPGRVHPGPPRPRAGSGRTAIGPAGWTPAARGARIGVTSGAPRSQAVRRVPRGAINLPRNDICRPGELRIPRAGS